MPTNGLTINYSRLAEGTSRVLQEGVSGETGRPTLKAKRMAESLAREVMSDPSVRQSYDIGKAFSTLFGYEEFSACRSDPHRDIGRVMEAAGGVTSAAFATINQQFIYSTLIEKYEIPEFKFSRKIPSRPSPFQYERVPGVSNIGDEALVVEENDEYPLATPAEDYRETPLTRNRGFRIPISRAAAFFDRTGLVVQRCSELGDFMGLNKEKRAIDCVIDAGETPTRQYRYKWRGTSSGALITSIATYGANSGDHSWDNLVTSNGLQDLTNISAAWQVLLAITDPFTGEPIEGNGDAKDIITPPSLVFQQPFTVANEVRRMNPGYATSGNPTQSIVTENPVNKFIGTLNHMWSQLLQSRMTLAGTAANSWWIGDIAKAFEYVENWPLAVLQLGTGSQDEFTRDIVQQFRVSERGTYATKQPRAMLMNTP